MVGVTITFKKNLISKGTTFSWFNPLCSTSAISLLNQTLFVVPRLYQSYFHTILNGFCNLKVAFTKKKKKKQSCSIQAHFRPSNQSMHRLIFRTKTEIGGNLSKAMRTET